MSLASTFSEFFVYHAPPQHMTAVDEAAGPGRGAFVDPISLASFPVAAAVVSTLTQIAVRALGWTVNSVAFIVALLIGALIFLITMTDPQARPKTWKEWLIAASIAFINSMLLYAATVGINQLQSAPAGIAPPAK